MKVADSLQQIAEQNAEVLALMRKGAQRRREEEARQQQPIPWRQSEPHQLRPSEFFLSIPGIGAILREQFKVVPEADGERPGVVERDDERAVIRCVCRARVELAFGGLESCRCGRFFYHGRTIRASAPA